MGKLYLRTLIPMFADMVALYCIYQFFSSTSRSGMMWFSFSMYLLCAVIATAVNCLLARRERALVSVVICNAAVIALCEALLIPTMQNTAGIVPWMVAPLFFAWPAVRSFTLIRSPATADIMLTYCDMSIMGIGFFLLIQAGDVFVPLPGTNLLCMVALAMNIVTLSSLRWASAVKVHAGAGSLHRNLLLILVIMAMLGAGLLLGYLFIPACRDLILLALTSLVNGVLWIVRQLGKLLLWLLSLFPEPDMGDLNLEPPMSVGGMEETAVQQDMPLWLLALLVGVVIAALTALALYTLYRLRRARLRWRLPASNVLVERGQTPKLLWLLGRMWQWVHFRSLLLMRRSTCGGLYARLELRGRRLGCARTPAQTPREYLSSLKAICAKDDCAVLEAFHFLADGIDRERFGGEASALPSRRQVRALLQATRHRPVNPLQALRALWGRICDQPEHANGQ